MSADDVYAKPLSFEDLLQFKALSPLSGPALQELARIEKLDIADFYEAEVRAYVIDPIVRVLGYEKGTNFSVDLGKPIEFLDKKKFPDYKFNLWQEDFWLIEAKRPRLSEASFGYEDLAQAVEYATHPKINAALVVLCDGVKIEIFDREVSLTTAVLHVVRENLTRDFDKIRILLEPWQVWFFQKRRIVRLLDKVFDKEFNLARVEEFRALVERRLASKRLIVLENFRRNVKPDNEEQKAHLLSAPIDELIDVHLFFEHSIPLTSTLINCLVVQSMARSFQVLYRIFPDHPRDANDTYFAQALTYLMALGEKRTTVEWLPAWLSPGQQGQANVEAAVRCLLRLCLTYFHDDEARKTILLAAAAFRRVFKLFFMSNEAQWRRAEALHFLARYQVAELSWGQIVASPKGQILGMLNGASLAATQRFVMGCRSEHGDLKTEVAKLQLKDILKVETALLASIDDYPKLRNERDLGEMHPTEAAGVTYDLLGHTTLCLISRFPNWQDYVLKEHHAEVVTLASMNSWSARQLLDLEQGEECLPASDADLANRFFYDDIAALNVIRAGYTVAK